MPKTQLLSPSQREDRRRRAIEALARGLTQKQVAALLETSVASVSQWKSRFHRGGVDDLAAKRQGRPPRLASGSPIDQVAAHLLAGAPETHGLRFGLWDGTTVAALIDRLTGTRLSRWTVLRYLDAWRIAPPAFASSPKTWPDAPRPAATTVIVQAGQRTDDADMHWLLWARRPRGEWSVLAYPHPPTVTDVRNFVERLLILWPARLTLVAPPGDPLWTATLLADCAVRWPGRLTPVPADPAPDRTHQKKLVTPN